MKNYSQDLKISTILVIDDNLLFLETLLELLETHGFQVIGSQSGLLGLQLAEEKMPDMIICDIRMPELNGYQVLIKLRQNSLTAKIPLIFITAKPIDQPQKVVQEMGANGYLIKPFSTTQLILTIKAQLETQ
ncbi:response regulator transcription factor [Allocoleopsis franciscana]|uniref:Response regulator with CheY-like receiver domain and winged-helix DNA-binding domain n=1 Tax=Allocoleopsis franciscana PCC 7113 TaxID=1173027 RepID=K9W9C5_9CYAN|nr:response regulator [Allocoleopsis franciscana]AFZ16995.1 response regulator with CheY-like receiver domain and winged-helix DNA-binding domain [Allocoleopsis franciscana PCC 7113]